MLRTRDTRRATRPLTEQQRRIKVMYDRPLVLEALADRTVPIPPELNIEQMLRDLSAVYLGMSDHLWPMN